MDHTRLLVAALAIALAVICALVAAIWKRSSSDDPSQAVTAGAVTFVSAITVAFLVVGYLQPH